MFVQQRHLICVLNACEAKWAGVRTHVTHQFSQKPAQCQEKKKKKHVHEGAIKYTNCPLSILIALSSVHLVLSKAMNALSATRNLSH